MDSCISRRDFLETTLVGSGAALLEGLARGSCSPHKIKMESPRPASQWNGYGGIGEYASANSIPGKFSPQDTSFATIPTSNL